VCSEYNRGQNSRQSMPSMEWGRMPTIPEMEDDQEGKDVNQGVEGSHSNGHGKEMDKEGHMMKIIEELQREAKER
jgi:hypothetical protein